jgi:hypothetical protein
MLRFARWLPLLLAITLVPGCAFLNQRAATRAIADAEQAWAKIAQQAHNVVPDQAKAIEDGIAAAKSKFATDPAAALAEAKVANEKIRALAEELPGLQAKLEDQWKDLSTTVPNALAALKKKLDDVGEPPAAMPERKQFDTIKATCAPLATRWEEARSLSASGKLADACAKGEDVKATAVQLIAELQTGS